MKRAQLLVFALAGGVASVSGLTQVQAPAAPPVEANTAQPPGQEDVLIQRIRTAQDPSTAIQAYAEARAVAPNDVAPLKAYVHRMAELGLPEMADLQAQDLLKKAPEDGIGWAVAGYLAAKRDQMEAAATNLAAAVRLAPDDPFVQRTAGQLVAWADTRPDKSVVTAPMRSAIDTLRTKLQGKTEYSQAYLDATTAYQRLASSANPTTQPAPAQSGGAAQPAAAPASPTTEPAAPMSIGPADDTLLAPTYVPGTGASYYPPTTYYPPTYYNDYYSGGYYEPYWYPRRWYGSSWWWPTATSFIIVDNECRDQFKHDHDHDHWANVDAWRRGRDLEHARGWDRDDRFWDRRYFARDRWPGDRFLGSDNGVAMHPGGGGRSMVSAPDRPSDPRNPRDPRTRSGEIRITPAPNGASRDADRARPAGSVIRVDPPVRPSAPARVAAPQRSSTPAPSPAPRAMDTPGRSAVAPSPAPRSMVVPSPAPAPRSAPRVVPPPPRSAPHVAAPPPVHHAGDGMNAGGRSPAAPSRSAAPARPSGPDPGAGARQFSPTQGRAR